MSSGSTMNLVSRFVSSRAGSLVRRILEQQLGAGLPTTPQPPTAGLSGRGESCDRQGDLRSSEVARSGDRPQHRNWRRLRPSDRGPRSSSSTGFFTAHGAASDRLKVGKNRLEPIASRILRAIEAGLQQVSQGHEVAFASATVLVTLPASIGSARVDGDRSIAGRLRLAAVQKARQANFIARALQFGEQSAVVSGHLFERDMSLELVKLAHRRKGGFGMVGHATLWPQGWQLKI